MRGDAPRPPAAGAAAGRPGQKGAGIIRQLEAPPLRTGSGTSRKQDGTIFPIEVALSPYREGESLFVTAAIRDVTDRKIEDDRLRQALRDRRLAQEETEAANRAKSDFLASMSHEIRTPLGVMLGYSDLLFNNAESKIERCHFADIIRRNGQHLLALVNDLLDLSKVEAGKLEIERRSIQLGEFLADLIAQFEAQSAAKKLTFELSICGTVPSDITTDEMRLRQILVNLVGNALKFTDIGGVSIQVSHRPDGQQGNGCLVFTVGDTGCGIAGDSQEKIFQPFTQAERYITRRYGGTGLGLGLAKKLSRELGGDVILKCSELGKGTEFELTVEIGIPAPQSWLDETMFRQVVERANRDRAIENRRGEHGATLRGIRILLAEDVEDNQNLMRLLLTGAGARVEIAHNGEEAVDLALRGGFDVVLMDIQMPVMNGYEATAALRERGYGQPILALTAHAMKGELERCTAAGCDGYISKPVNRADLVRKILAHATADLAGARLSELAKELRGKPELGDT